MNPLQNEKTCRPAVLFLAPAYWESMTRLVKELHFLSKTGICKPIVISTEIKYILSSGIFEEGIHKVLRKNQVHDMGIASQELTVYNVPFFVVPISLQASLNMISKFFYLSFYALSVIVYTLYLFFVSFFICLSQKVRLVHALNSPDLTGVVAYLISKITNIPYIFEIQDLTPELFCDTMGVPVNGTIFSFLRAIEGVVVPNSAKTIFVSEATRDYTVSRYKLESSKCIVIYNSLNKSFIRRFFCNEEQLKSNKKHRLLQSRFKVVYLGSLEAKIRGLDDLVMSIKFLVKSQGFKDITLVFVGDGDMKNELIEFVRRLGLSQNVIFTGALPRNEAWKWLQIADVAVVPHKKSLATEFTIPTKLFEYMAAGKVIIASNLRGLREVIKDGYNGLLFAPNDSADLARKILEAKANLNRQELAGHAKNDFDEKYYGEKGEEKIRQLYKELLK